MKILPPKIPIQKYEQAFPLTFYLNKTKKNRLNSSLIQQSVTVPGAAEAERLHILPGASDLRLQLIKPEHYPDKGCSRTGVH